MVRTLFKNLQIKWWLFRGKRERIRENPARAIKYFERVLAINPFHAFALAQIGSCHYDLQRYDEALNAFNQALE